MKISAVFVLSTVLCLTAAPLFAAEGILVVQKTTVGARTRIHQVQIEKNRMRTETEAINGQKQVIVFDGPKQVLTTIYPDRKVYSELTKAEADRMGGGRITLSPAVQEQMAKMPPEQRALMEQMMRGRGASAAAAPPAKMEYRRAGSDKVGKWTCDKYEGFQNNVKKMDICTVDPKALGVSMAELDITRQMAAFFGKMAPQSSSTFEAGTVETVGFAGVPVRTIGYGSKGEVVYSSEISEVSRQNFPASNFTVPPGFQKQSVLGGRGATP